MFDPGQCNPPWFVHTRADVVRVRGKVQFLFIEQGFPACMPPQSRTLAEPAERRIRAIDSIVHPTCNYHDAPYERLRAYTCMQSSTKRSFSLVMLSRPYYDVPICSSYIQCVYTADVVLDQNRPARHFPMSHFS